MQAFDTTQHGEHTVTASPTTAQAASSGAPTTPPPPDQDSRADSTESVDPNAGQKPAVAGITLPCVIPQTTRAYKGRFSSPFVRAWIPDLEKHSISKDEFLAFIDNLNECWIPNPVLEGVNLVGVGMSFVPLPELQITGVSLQLKAQAGSVGISMFRTKKYLGAVNENMFHPVGLHAEMLKTDKMMAKIGHPENSLTLPPMEIPEEIPVDIANMDPKEAARLARLGKDHEDPRVKRLQALEGYVAPLTLDVPESVPQEAFWKRMGVSHANMIARNHEQRLWKEDRRVDEKYFENVKKSEKVKEKYDAEIAEIEKNAAGASEEKKAKLEQKLEKKQEERNDKVSEKMVHAVQDHQKREIKANKKVNKIQWVVISKWDGQKSLGTDHDSDE